MFDSLSLKLEKAFQTLKGQGRITEINVASTVKEIRKALIGGQSEDIKIEGNPAIILIAGLQGSGKTTFSGKLAHYLKRQGRQVLLTACDIYRPAAIDQLKVLGEQVGVEVYAEPENKDAVSIARAAVEHAR